MGANERKSASLTLTSTYPIGFRVGRAANPFLLAVSRIPRRDK